MFRYTFQMGPVEEDANLPTLCIEQGTLACSATAKTPIALPPQGGWTFLSTSNVPALPSQLTKIYCVVVAGRCEAGLDIQAALTAPSGLEEGRLQGEFGRYGKKPRTLCPHKVGGHSCPPRTSLRILLCCCGWLL